MIVLREMKLTDYEACFSIWDELPSIGVSSADTKESINLYLERNPTMSQVAVDGEKIVGAALCGHDGRRGYIHHLSIIKEYQRKGIGKKLFTKCFEKLAEVGIKKCHIFVVSDNLDAIEFWKKIGWEHREYLILMSKKTENI